MIIGQAIFQLVVTLVLYFSGHEILGYDRQNAQHQLELDTIIFNTFVWMQIFNEFNNRRLDNKFNIFEGVHRNQFFIFINCIMVGLQVAIIFVGSRAFQINPGGLDGTQWAISVVLGAFSLPWGVLIRVFPDSWFAVFAETVGGPLVVLYDFISRGWARAKRVFKKQGQEEAKGSDEEAAAGQQNVTTPVITVYEPIVSEKKEG